MQWQLTFRIIGTIAITLLCNSHILPAKYLGLSDADLTAVGCVIAFAFSFVWNRIEAHAKGLTPNSPNPPSNIPSLKTPVAELNSKAQVVKINPNPTPKA
jgi:hypothetical protein